MINKKNLWFITLLSLILVLGVYYITMPNELLKTKEVLESVNSKINVVVEENDKLVALRVERDEEIETTMKELQSILTSTTSTTDEKNNAFEELKVLNLTKGKESEYKEKMYITVKFES